ncbi:MAG: DoxX family protein [Chroococcidiopsidaceae cyanobacterium CP_BM_RX_35]|nr:DoxX family protein [Chroococcidiopsidaceae cyanobacterium CP_BM_RX_35]
MIYRFAIGFAISFLLATTNPLLGPHLISAVNVTYPGGAPGAALFLLRASVGVLFLLHGYPKITHLQQWASSLKMPKFFCFLSALSMLLGGICLICGFLTLLASVAILGSMAFAMFLEISQGLPFVARDPYLIPPDQYKGPKGQGEPPSWEKAFIYCIMLITIAILGPGAFSLDALIFGR